MITLTKATPKAIRYACLKFHYAKAVPSVQYGYNVYENGEWCGVICFGGGATPHLASSVGLIPGEVLELERVALNGKQSTTSECVAAAVRQLHREAPQLKMLVSYADCDQNHYGTIYQATNWIYLGCMNEGERGAFIINGKKIHPRSVGAAGYKQSLQWLREHIDSNAEEFRTRGKQKYIYVFDKKLRKKWLSKALPYPKKGCDTNGE